MKNTKFLFAALAIVFAAGSAFTSVKKKAVFEKSWFQLVDLAHPELASSYELTSPLMGDPGDDIECPKTYSSTVCAVFATPELDINSIARPNSVELANIDANSNGFTEAILEDDVLQYVEE